MLSSPPPEDNPLAGIVAAAHAAELAAGAATPDERLAVLETRVASIEPLLEQLQAQTELGSRIKVYVEDLRAEQRFFNVARWVVGPLCLFAVLALGWLLRDAIYNPLSPLLKAPPVAIATFVIGVLSGIVLLLSGFTKAVFRMASDRHAEGFLPPALNAALEAYQKIMGGPSKP